MAAVGDSIVAVSTARGRAGVAVVRISGPMAADAAQALSGRLPAPREARLRVFRDPMTGEIIDRGLLLWFPEPGSATGEDVAEFHVHGGPAVLDGMLQALTALPGCRPAEAGEFTRRAFASGKLDLTAAEGLADLVAAETAAQRRQALRQADGVFGRLTDDWAERVMRSLAYLEAGLDFPDEDLFADLLAEGKAEVGAAANEIRRHLADGRRGEILRDGLSVAIIGPPNSGKSSLLNRLAGKEAAIVSATAGTTRDVIEVHLDLGGYPIILADTAGLRTEGDEIEAEGIRRARARAASADLTLLVLDATENVSRETFSEPDAARTVLVWNKIDLATPQSDGIAVSAKTGAGIDTLIAALTASAEELLAGEAPMVTRQRHRVALETALVAMDRADAGTEAALVAEDLRLAVRALGRITGQVDVEDLLDIIFRDFCIGK